jgi:hypothetical protein
MLTNYPASIVVHGMALNITVQSYDQSLDFGLMSDAQAMPQVRELADAIVVAFDDLAALPRPGEAGHPDTAAPKSLASRAGGAMADAAGAVGKLAGGVAGSMASAALSGAMTGAMSGAMKGAMTGAVARVGRKAPATRTSAASPARKPGSR